MGSFLSLFKVIVEGKSSKRFLLASILSFGFSISVILSTIGLMDGFEHTLRFSLKKSNSDFIITSRNGFFLDTELKNINKGYVLASILQTEAFAVGKNSNRGILLKGINPINFNQATNLDIDIDEKSICIGKVLAESFKLKLGDELTLALSSNRKRDQGSAILKSFKITKIIEHGIYEKDLRFAYVDKDFLISILGYRQGTTNKALIKKSKDMSFEQAQFDLENNIPEQFEVQPFWSEYKTLIDAVEVEKNSITAILQIIVIVAVFNVLAFVIFIFEKKAQDFFLLRAMGLSLKKLNRFWLSLLALIWFFSAILAIILTHLFNFALSDLNIFQIPGDIYVLNKLSLILDVQDYLGVLFISFLWIMIIGLLLLSRMKQKSLLAGLRQEFR